MDIGRILVAEFKDQESSVFEAVMEVLKHHSNFEILERGMKRWFQFPVLRFTQNAERYTVIGARLT